MASSAASPELAARHLGRLLTGSEAKDLADQLADGDSLTVALKSIPAGRRSEIRALLQAIALAPSDAVPVLRSIEGARSIATALDPLWTMPGHLARSGPLTSSVSHLVAGARQSITCSTFNFQRSSALWQALHDAARRPEIKLRVYVDANAADGKSTKWSPRTSEVAALLKPGIVLRTREFDGKYVRNHAKFLAIDHRFLLVTSANFSYSAEHGNVEFGVLIDNANFTEAVERELRRAEDTLYERVWG